MFVKENARQRWFTGFIQLFSFLRLDSEKII